MATMQVASMSRMCSSRGQGSSPGQGGLAFERAGTAGAGASATGAGADAAVGVSDVAVAG